MNNIENKKVFFEATYDYGAKIDRLRKKKAISSFFNDILVRIFKGFIYPGASFLKGKIIDFKRIKEGKNQLFSMGGTSLSLKTPDGDLLDGMYLDAKEFKAKLTKYFDLIEKDNGDGTLSQKLVIKKELCTEEYKILASGISCTWLKPNAETELFLENITRLGINISPYSVISEEDNTRGVCVDLGNVPVNLEKIEPISEENQSEPTVLLATGSGMTYSAYKGLALAYLLRGIHVMMVDFRGYGESEGSPTEHKTKLDLETAYQYLSKEKKVQNRDLIVHGHCIGGGPAADLAARRKGVNLILDRSFAEFRDVAQNRFPIISRLVRKIMPSIVNYNNKDNLKHVKGNIAIVMASNDQVISKEQTIEQINSLPNTKKGQVCKLIDWPEGHTGDWTNDPLTSLQFDQFLEQIHLRKRLF